MDCDNCGKIIKIGDTYYTDTDLDKNFCSRDCALKSYEKEYLQELVYEEEEEI